MSKRQYARRSYFSHLTNERRRGVYRLRAIKDQEVPDLSLFENRYPDGPSEPIAFNGEIDRSRPVRAIRIRWWKRPQSTQTGPSHQNSAPAHALNFLNGVGRCEILEFCTLRPTTLGKYVQIENLLQYP
jgi:hypothetical protein